MTSQPRWYYRWIKVLLLAGGFAAFFFPMPTSRISRVSAQSGERMATFSLPAAALSRAPRLKSPPVIAADEKARLQAVQAQFHRRGPVTRVGSSTAPSAAPRNFPATTPRAAATRAQPRTGSRTNAPGTFTLFQDTDLHTIISDTVSVVAEPSAGNTGSAVLETGNWFAAVSTDGGSTFGYVDVFDPVFLPASYGGFCCDQSVLYDPSRNIMLWTLLYVPNSSGNIIRLVIANGEAAFTPDHVVVYRYDLSPQSIMQGGVPVFPAGEWYDYPQIALSNNYLYITANVFAAPFPTGPFDKTVVLRLPLDALAVHGGFSGAAFITNDFNATPVQHATTTMYWATQVRTNTATMRVYDWPEGGIVSSVDIAHTPYPDPNPANYTCPLTGGVQDWCGRLDDRVQTGWLSGGMLAFVWNAPKGTAGSTTFNYPYVQFLFLNSYTMTLMGESAINSNAYAYAYPSAGLNAWGHVAGTLFYGGGAVPPTLAAFVWDNYSTTPYPQIPATWDIYTIAASTQGPSDTRCPNCWGDYLRTTMDHTSVFSRFLWIATGYTLQGGGLESNIHPLYLRFGREANDPASVELNNKPLYLPLISKSP